MPAVTLDTVSWDPVASGSTSGGWVLSSDFTSLTATDVTYTVGHSVSITWSGLGLSTGYWCTTDSTIGSTAKSTGALYTINSTNNTIYYFWSVTGASGARTSPYRAKKVRFVQATAPSNAHPTDLSFSTATTESETPAVTVTISGGSGTMEYAIATGASSTTAASNFTDVTGSSFSVTSVKRGGDHTDSLPSPKDKSYWFHVRNKALAQAGNTTGRVEEYNPPFLPTDESITVSPASQNSASGTGWSVTLSDITGSYNNYTVSEQNSLYPTEWTSSSTGVGNTTLTHTDSSNPITGTKTYYIWTSRTKTTGGNGGQGWPESGDSYKTDEGWNVTNASFTVTRGGDPSVTDTTGLFFDSTSSAVDASNSDSSIKSRVTLTNLDTAKRYVIAEYTSGAWVANSSGWFNGVNYSNTIVIPYAYVLNTAASFRVYSRTDNTDNFSGATHESTLNFTREAKSASASTPANTSLAANATTYQVNVTETYAGWTYYIYDGSGSSATSGGSTVATGSSTSITVTGTGLMPGNSDGNTKTVYLWVSSPHNGLGNNVAMPTGQTITVTRSNNTGTTPTTSGTHGMIIKNFSGTTTVDTTSRLARIVKSSATSGTLTASGGGFIAGNADSPTVSVPGMTNDPTAWHVMVTREIWESSTWNMWWNLNPYTVTMMNDGFKIKNNQYVSASSNTGAKYEYIVLRTKN